MIQVLASGRLNTVQDLGRRGHRGIGVGFAGAMDRLALELGNCLVGNAPDAAAVEIAMPPFAVRFEADAEFAITGAQCAADLDGEPVHAWWVRGARRGQVLRIGPPTAGAIAYLSVAGGIDVPAVLGSRSTDLKARFGGVEGRALRAGDVLPTGRATSASRPRSRPFGIEPPEYALANSQPASARGTALRVLPAGEYERFPPQVRATWRQTAWKLSPSSNRSAFRLLGPALGADRHGDIMYSHGIVPGVIQVPPSGEPIVQMADANTHGGYPKLGVVIGPDLRLLAQTRLGSTVRFVEVGHEDAVAALAAQRRYVHAVCEAVASRRALSIPD